MSRQGGGEGSIPCTIYHPMRRELANRIYISVRAYHDELVQHGDVFELRIAIEKQSSMICIGQSLFVQCLKKTKQKKHLLFNDIFSHHYSFRFLKIAAVGRSACLTAV